MTFLEGCWLCPNRRETSFEYELSTVPVAISNPDGS